MCILSLKKACIFFNILQILVSNICFNYMVEGKCVSDIPIILGIVRIWPKIVTTFVNLKL